MLTEEYLKDHFITAHFIDNERQNIEILMTNEDKTTTIHTLFLLMKKMLSIKRYKLFLL